VNIVGAWRKLIQKQADLLMIFILFGEGEGGRKSLSSIKERMSRGSQEGSQ